MFGFVGVCECAFAAADDLLGVATLPFSDVTGATEPVRRTLELGSRPGMQITPRGTVTVDVTFARTATGVVRAAHLTRARALVRALPLMYRHLADLRGQGGLPQTVSASALADDQLPTPIREELEKADKVVFTSRMRPKLVHSDTDSADAAAATAASSTASSTGNAYSNSKAGTAASSGAATGSNGSLGSASAQASSTLSAVLTSLTGNSMSSTSATVKPPVRMLGIHRMQRGTPAESLHVEGGGGGESAPCGIAKPT